LFKNRKQTNTKFKAATKKIGLRIKLQRVLQIILLIAFLLLIWRGWTYTKPSNFPVMHVKIVATFEHTNQELLQKIIAPYINYGFFYLNVIGLKHQLLKLPWVYAVSITREWPDTLSISVVEQHPLAQWGNEALVNSEGKIFSAPVESFPSGLPVIFGPTNRVTEIFEDYQKIEPLVETINAKVKQLVLLADQNYWELTLENGMAIFLKPKDPAGQLQFFLKLYPKIIANHPAPPKSIDLRYDIGFAIKWD
jgi:cell division protein FtsQ